MLFFQLLVFTCACALGAVAEVPPYGQMIDSIMEAWALLNKNILYVPIRSMDGNIPLRDDSRRHYAEIMHVVYDEALNERDCLLHDYYKDYQRNVNKSGPFGIANPQSVVDETKKLIEKIIIEIDKIIQLVKASASSGTEDSDKAVDEEIKNNVEKYGLSLDVFFATALAATQLNKDHKDYFAAAAKNLNANSFVITGASKLEKIVMAQKNLNGFLYPLPC